MLINLKWASFNQISAYMINNNQPSLLVISKLG
jgi:hypothetical protein